MSSETAPPSIPPRKRPTPQGNRSPRSGGSSAAASLRPAGAEPDVTLAAPGAAYSSAPTREPVAVSTAAPSRPTTSSAPAPSSSVGVDEEPSPLQVAVGSVTQTLKKAAAATTAAFSSATTRTRTEDHTMSSPTSPRADKAASSAPVDSAFGARPSTGRIPAVPSTGAPRRVRLAVSRIDPWSVMKLSFLLSVAIGIMIVIAAAVLWFALDSMHVFAQIDSLISEVLGSESPEDVMQYFEFSRTVSAATIIAVVDVFLLTALSTIAAFLYNITATLVGGVHLTLTDD